MVSHLPHLVPWYASLKRVYRVTIETKPRTLMDWTMSQEAAPLGQGHMQPLMSVMSPFLLMTRHAVEVQLTSQEELAP